MHKDHIHCLFLARRYLERQGYAVLLGALQPTSDEYVSWKLQGQAMGFRNRFTACELAAMGSTDETRIDEEPSEGGTVNTMGDQEAGRWIETWCSTDVNGNDAAKHCQHFLSRACQCPVAAFNVCGSDFLSRLGSWDFNLPGPVQYVVVPREGDPLPKSKPGKGWHVAETNTNTDDHNASSTRIRTLILGGDWQGLVTQRLINQAESTFLRTQHKAGRLYLGAAP